MLLANLQGAGRIDWSRAGVDSASVRAVGAGGKTGPNPTDRAKPGSKHHLLTDAIGIPLGKTVTGANTPDVQPLLPLVEAIPPVRGQRGRPRRRPKKLYTDRAYDSQPHRQPNGQEPGFYEVQDEKLRDLGIEPVLAKRGTGHGSGLGIFRWVVERSLSWLHQFRRLRVRYERRADIHEAFVSVACCLICWSFL